LLHTSPFRPVVADALVCAVPDVPDLAIHDCNLMVSTNVAEVPLSLLGNLLTEFLACVLGVVRLSRLLVLHPSVPLHQDADALVGTLVIASFTLDLCQVHDHLIVGDFASHRNATDSAIPCDAVLGICVVVVEGGGVRIFLLSCHVIVSFLF